MADSSQAKAPAVPLPAPMPPPLPSAPAPAAALVPEYHMLVRRDVFALVPRGSGTLLDVGGGIGATAAALKAEGYAQRAGVVDLVAETSVAPGLDFHIGADLEAPGSLEALGAAEGPFQTILCLDVLEHLVDPWAVIARLHAILAPGGVIIASIPNLRYYRALFPLVFFGKWELTDRGILDRTHLRWFVRASAAALMTSSGLHLEALVAKPGGGRLAGLIHILTLGLFRDFRTIQYLVRVRRV